MSQTNGETDPVASQGLRKNPTLAGKNQRPDFGPLRNVHSEILKVFEVFEGFKVFRIRGVWVWGHGLSLFATPDDGTTNFDANTIRTS